MEARDNRVAELLEVAIAPLEEQMDELASIGAAKELPDFLEGVPDALRGCQEGARVGVAAEELLEQRLQVGQGALETREEEAGVALAELVENRLHVRLPPLDELLSRRGQQGEIILERLECRVHPGDGGLDFGIGLSDGSEGLPHGHLGVLVGLGRELGLLGVRELRVRQVLQGLFLGDGGANHLLLSLGEGIVRLEHRGVVRDALSRELRRRRSSAARSPSSGP